MKVNKEEIGMLAALELYVAKDHEEEGKEFDKRGDDPQQRRVGARRQGRSLRAGRQPRCRTSA